MLIHTVKDLINELNKLDKDMPIRTIRNKKYSHVDVVIDAVFDPEEEFINIVVVHWFFLFFKKKLLTNKNQGLLCLYWVIKGVNFMSNNEVANIIQQQIGHKALYMIGAKNLMAIDNGLAFKIMKNAKGVNYVEIKLNGKDLYDIRYCYVSVKGVKEISVDNDIYADMLNKSIEDNTGLYTKLF